MELFCPVCKKPATIADQHKVETEDSTGESEVTRYMLECMTCSDVIIATVDISTKA